MDINAVILCAGKGTRMKSDLPKVVHKVCEYEMVNLVLKSLTEAGIENNNLVLGYKKEEVINRIDSKFEISTSIQDEQLGTGHAVKCANEFLVDKKGVTIVTYGDTPLVTSDTYGKLLEYHIESKNDLTVLTAKLDDATNYGRIIRDSDGKVRAIVEEKDATSEEKQITEFNSGIYCFDNEKLIKHLYDLTNDNAQQEYYLTDLVQIFNENGYQVGAYVSTDAKELEGVNDLVNLAKASKVLQLRTNEQHLINGVNIIDPSTTYIGPNVKIEAGTTIEPNNYIYGNVQIGRNNLLKTGNYIVDTIIGDENVIGPHAHFRNNSKLGDNCRIGNYVEVKNSTIDNLTNAAHLTYLGDAEIGSNVNFGCGVITANYDGISKHKTIIKDNVFVGSNANLIAPLEIEQDVFIAAGTTVSDNISANKFVIDRADIRIKDRR